MKTSHRMLLGGLMIVAGIIFLLENLNIISIGSYLWGGLLVIGGLAFFSIYVVDRSQWWFIIPAFVLIGIGAIVILATAFPNMQGELIPSVIMGAIGLSFAAVYLSNTENWWAIIPAGTLLTLAVAIGLSGITGGFGFVSIFFLGLALTFGILYFIPTPEGRMTWAIYPALGTLAVGVLVSLGAGAIGPYLWPVALIIGGLFLIYRTFRSR